MLLLLWQVKDTRGRELDLSGNVVASCDILVGTADDVFNVTSVDVVAA